MDYDIKMKPYIATFSLVGWDWMQTEVTVKCDGISDNHAQARAWIRFMTTRLYKSDADGWELLELKEL